VNGEALRLCSSVSERLVDLVEDEVEPLGDGFGVEPSLLGEGADTSNRQSTALDVGFVFDFRDDSSPGFAHRIVVGSTGISMSTPGFLVRRHLLIRAEQCDEACLSGTDLVLEWFCLGLR